MPPLSGLSGSPNAPQQHKQTSRKGKKAWRKNVDVTEIQKGMEAGVEEEILFGKKLADKGADELFQFDTTADVKLQTKFNLKPKAKRLKADQIIAERSAVPALASRKRSAPDFVKGMVVMKKRKSDWVSSKELSHLREVADGHHEIPITIEDATYDIWATDPTAAKPKNKEGDVLEFLPEKTGPRVPESLKRKPISLAANGKPIPAVSKPSGGYSYNPRFDDYQKRYVEVSNQVVEEERRRLQAEAEEEARAIDVAKSAAEAEAAEAKAEMSEWEDDTDWEGIESEPEGFKKKMPRRKTRAQRNKEKRRKEEEAQKKHEKEMKKRDAQAARIKAIAKELSERDRQVALRKQEGDSEDSDEGNDEVLRRKQLGRIHVPRKDLELVLPDELQDSLRLLKPEGNLLNDRYRSMLVRGKIEARRGIPHRKQAKFKWTEKWTFKDFKVPQ